MKRAPMRFVVCTRTLCFTAAPLVALLAALCGLALADPWDESEVRPNEEYEYELDDSWYNSATLPDVDLEGLVANLSAQISWFKYVGNATLECTYRAKEEDTLMLAIESLHNCLEGHYQKCASEFANQTGCEVTHNTIQPCGTFRMGLLGVSNPEYGHLMDCRWYLEVPEIFHLNLTVDEFYVEASGPGCPYDHVMFYDGNTTAATSYGPYCGRRPRFTIYATGKQMMIIAHTDGSVGKLGFRGVYQVMDAGIGVTMNDSILYNLVQSGGFTIDNSPITNFDTYVTSYYNTFWRIRMDWGQYIAFRISYSLEVNKDYGYVYEGGLDRNHLKQLLYTLRAQANQTQNYVDVSAGFLMTIQVARKSIVNSTTQFNVSFKAVDYGGEGLNTRMSQYGIQCTSRLLNDSESLPSSRKADIDFNGELENNTIRIGLHSAAKMDPPGHPILCHWRLEAPADKYIEMEVNELTVNAPNEEGCMYEGLVVTDGGSLSPDIQRLGPFCYTEPKHLFTTRGVNTIVSSGQVLSVFFYTYMGYDKKSHIKRGVFSANVKVTACQGLWQPCNGMLPALQDPLFTHIEVTGLYNNTNVHVYCKRSQCCFIQQYPIYTHMPNTTCNIHVGSKGPKWMTTSAFQTRLVVPDKITDTMLYYSCQRRQNLMSLSRYGHRESCKGTQVHVQYETTSPWASGAFSVRIQPAECGYYRPDLHPSNILYMPCATADLPFESKSYNMSIIDAFPEADKYYLFTLDYPKGADKCPAKDCIKDSLTISAGEFSFRWSDVQITPLGWREWGLGAGDKSWAREVQVDRRVDQTCIRRNGLDDESQQSYISQCRLLIKVQEERIGKTIKQKAGLRCPQGFKLIGGSCYALVWPGDEEKLPNNYTTTVNLARKTCQQMSSAADLASLHGYEEIEDIRLAMFYTWWTPYMMRMPGLKVFPLGLKYNHQTSHFEWMTGEPVTFVHWNIPDYFGRSPDQTTDPNDPGRVWKALQPKELRDAREHMQPWMEQEGDCTVMVVSSPLDEPYWLKVSCELEIPFMVPLCEVSPAATPGEGELKPLKALVGKDAASYRTTISLDNDGNHRLVPTKYECAPSFTMVGDKCLALYTVKERTIANARTPINDCKNNYKYTSPAWSGIIGRPAVINQDYLGVVSQALGSWLIGPRSGRIRVVYGDSNNQSTVDKVCDVLVAVPDSNPLRWTIETLDAESECSSSTLTDVHTFLCESDPQPVLRSECGIHQYACADGTCIVLHDVCDGHRDCLGGEDEATCKHVCQFKDPEVLGSALRPPGGTGKDCFSRGCNQTTCECSELYFQCHVGGCIPISKVCNYIAECDDGSDEELCNKFPCEKDEFKCSSGQCIPQLQQCDFTPDCFDGTDEKNCGFERGCPSLNGYRCPSSGKCIPTIFADDMYPDCPGTPVPDEGDFLALYQKSELTKTGILMLKETEICDTTNSGCSPYMEHNCMDRKLTCVYDRRKSLGTLNGCRTGVHLGHACAERVCAGMFKCRDSYCLALNKICDGNRDCQGGEDEQSCDSLYCPGMLRCKGSAFCVRHSDTCDGEVHCPRHMDDEALCQYSTQGCPAGCQCLGNAVSCVGNGLEEVPTSTVLIDNLRAVILRGNKFKSFMTLEFNAAKLHRFDLSKNLIQSIGEHVFKGMKMLVELYIHDNKLTSLSRSFFMDLAYLKVLTLHANEIVHITVEAFKGLSSLPVLNLGGQRLRSLEDSHFAGLDAIQSINLSYNNIQNIRENCFSNKIGQKAVPFYKLEYLNIEGNPIVSEASNAFFFLPPQAHLISDKFKYCCFARHIALCHPEPDEFSSCEDLLANKPLKIAIWTVGVLAFVGNIIVLHQRMKHERETTPSLLVQHLAFSDCIMGFYVLIIAAADQYHKGVYIHHADDWRANALCKLAGFLSMLSCEMSMFLLMLIALDRKYATDRTANASGIGVRGVRGLIALGWTFGAIISVVPILEFSYFGSGYIRSGVCTLFNLVEGRKSGWEFTLAVFILFNVLCVGVMANGYFRSCWSYQQGVDDWPLNEELTDEEKEAEIEFRKNEMIITRRLVMMVLTDVIIWTPLVYMGVQTLIGFPINKTLSAWVTMFLMPLNAAINPFLYTFSAKPHRLPIDDLLRNWVELEEDLDDMDDDDDFRADTEMGDSSVGGSTLTTNTKGLDEKSEAEKEKDEQAGN